MWSMNFVHVFNKHVGFVGISADSSEFRRILFVQFDPLLSSDLNNNNNNNKHAAGRAAGARAGPCACGAPAPVHAGVPRLELHHPRSDRLALGARALRRRPGPLAGVSDSCVVCVSGFSRPTAVSKLSRAVSKCMEMQTIDWPRTVIAGYFRFFAETLECFSDML